MEWIAYLSVRAFRINMYGTVAERWYVYCSAQTVFAVN